MGQASVVAVAVSGPFAEAPFLAIVMLLGVMLCSLLCVMAALLHGGETLQRSSVMLISQVYLVLTALLQLSVAGDRIVAQVAGVLVFALGVAPGFFRKNNFRAARYCIAVGSVVAACAILLF